MYASSTVVTGVLRRLRGRQLLVTSESLILNVMMRRISTLGPMMWESCVTEDGTVISLDTFNRKWKESNNSLLNDDVLAALYCRFGEPFTTLEEGLLKAKTDPIKCDQKHLYEMAWETYHGGRIATSTETSSSSKNIDESLLYLFLIEWTDMYALMECQISRTAGLIEDLFDHVATSKVMEEVAGRCGLNAIVPWKFMPLLNSISACTGVALAKTSDTILVTVGQVHAYCFARATYRKDGQKPAAAMALTSLIRPGQKVIGGSRRNLQEKEEEDEFEVPMHPHGSASTTPLARNHHSHVLSIFLQQPKVSSGSVLIKTNALLEHIRTCSPTLTPSLSLAIVHCCAVIDEYSLDYDRDNVVSLQAVEKFIYPLGFSVNVRLPLGSFRKYCKPLDTVEFIYREVAKQLFMTLRKRQPGGNARVPSDVKIYRSVYSRTHFVYTLSTTLSTTLPTTLSTTLPTHLLNPPTQSTPSTHPPSICHPLLNPSSIHLSHMNILVTKL